MFGWAFFEMCAYVFVRINGVRMSKIDKRDSIILLVEGLMEECTSLLSFLYR